MKKKLNDEELNNVSGGCGEDYTYESGDTPKFKEGLIVDFTNIEKDAIDCGTIVKVNPKTSLPALNGHYKSGNQFTYDIKSSGKLHENVAEALIKFKQQHF